MICNKSTSKILEIAGYFVNFIVELNDLYMKKLILIIFLGIIIYSCTSDNTIDIPTVEGSTFLRTGYVLESAVDANGDGVFSKDLMEEGACISDGLRFREDKTVFNPTASFLSLNVIDDGNGNLIQKLRCSHADGTFPTYTEKDNIINFLFNGEIAFTGLLSNDGNTLTFTFPNELLYGFNLSIGGNDILKQDNTVEEYQGNAIVTYIRQ